MALLKFYPDLNDAGLFTPNGSLAVANGFLGLPTTGDLDRVNDWYDSAEIPFPNAGPATKTITGFITVPVGAPSGFLNAFTQHGGASSIVFQIAVRTNAGGGILAVFASGSTANKSQSNGDTNIADGKERFFAITANGNDINIYLAETAAPTVVEETYVINSIQDAVSGSGHTGTGVSQNLEVGSEQNGSNLFRGIIDRLRFDNETLSIVQIQALLNAEIVLRDGPAGGSSAATLLLLS